MYRPQYRPWKHLSPPVAGHREARGWFLALLDIIGGWYVRIACGIDRIHLENTQSLLVQYRQAFKHEGRFILAFRHPGDFDPQVVFHSLNTRLKGAYVDAGLPARPGLVPLAGAEIPTWGGPVVRWALRSVGSIPVSHGTMSRTGMDQIIGTLVSLPQPVALAPEGQVSYFSRMPPQLDDGTAQIAVWAYHRLKGQDKVAGATKLNILPTGIRYQYPRETWGRLDRFLRDIEGLVSPGDQVGGGLDRSLTKRRGWQDLPPRHRADLPGPAEQAILDRWTSRLRLIWEKILDHLEDHYHRAYRYQAPMTGTGPEERTRGLMVHALAMAEAYAGVSPVGDPRERAMYLRSLTMAVSQVPPPGISWLSRRLHNRAAAEAWYLHRHEELADLAFYLTEEAVLGGRCFDDLVESAQNLMDFALRGIGGSFGSRRRYFRGEVRMEFGEPIAVADYLEPSRRATIAKLGEALRQAFLTLLEPSS